MDVAKGLSEAHQIDFFHNEMKPENIFLNNNEKAERIEFLIGGWKI